MEIREFKLEDAEAVSGVMNAAFKAFLQERWDEYDAQSFAPETLNRMSNVRADFSVTASFVAVEGERVMGYIRGTANANRLGSLEVVGVDPEGFHKGIGKALMSRLEQFWQEHALRKVCTCVSADNTRALIYYIANGFIPVGYRRDHFKIGIDEIMLDRFLSK